MNITEFFIKRPVLTTLVMLGLLFFGIVAYTSMPVSYMPSVEYPTISVSASLPGASPDTMASTVASPLEREFSSIPGLSSMSSSSSLSSTSITLQFDLEKDIDVAAMDVQSAISKASGSLPTNMPSQPTYSKVNPSDQPIFYISLKSETLPLSKINEYAKTFLTRNISMIKGVAQVEIYGEKKYAVRVRLDPRALATRSLGINEVVDAVSTANVNLPLGDLEGAAQNITINADGQLESAEDYRSIIVSSKDNMPVRLDDLGTVKDGVQDERFSAWSNGRQNILIAVKRQPGSNTIAVVDAIKERLPAIKKQLPAALEMDILYDMSIFIKESVEDVKFTLALAVGLVILVVFIFLRSVAGTFIASVAIPFSIIATFAVMYEMGFTLDTLSLMALTLSVGFVVDDAIVMLENIFRHMEMGKKPLQAALDGAKEIGFTIISMTLSLAVVFVPVMFMSGLIGRVMHEFAMTITIAILVSGVVSLSLTPMLGSRVLRPSSKLASSDPVFNLLQNIYKVTLGWALKLRWLTMLIAVVLLGVTVHFFIIMPKGFLPTNDMDYVYGFAEAREGIPYKGMLDLQMQLEPLLRDDPNVKSVNLIVSVPAENEGMLYIMLKPRNERPLSADEYIRSVWGKVNSIPGMLGFLMNPPMIQIGGKSGKGEYQYTLLSADNQVLYAEAPKFEAKLRELKQLVGVNSDLKISHPQLNLRFNRDMAGMHNVTVNDIEDALYSAYGGREVSTIYTANDDYKVIVELSEDFQQDPKAISMLYIRNSDNKLVRLDNLVDTEMGQGPVTVNHSGQLPSVTYSFNLAPGVTLGDVTGLLDNLAQTALPDTIATQFEGAASAFDESMMSMYFLLGIAIAVIYIILGCLYESFIHPITILSGLPSAALGGLLTLYVFGMELNLYGFVGIIMLIGIVKKNSIMVVDFAIEAEKQGKGPVEAAFEGSLVRFRPIIMTTLAAIMGALPIAVGYGAGGDSRKPLGLVVVGGLILSQVVTLYLTPVFYSYMDQLQNYLTKNKQHDKQAEQTI